MDIENCKLLFFTVANSAYYKFVPLYAFFALSYNPGSTVEIVVEDIKELDSIHGDAIFYIKEMFPRGSLKIRESQYFKTIKPNTIRFIEVPETENYTHVYIADIDILILESGIAISHIDHMNKNNLSFSNIVRKKTILDKYPRLTGCHFAPKEIQYPIPDMFDLDLKEFNDERVLHEIMRRKKIFISNDNEYRPIHGLHISPNRKIVDTKKPSWNVGNEIYLSEFLTFISTSEFKSFYHTLDVSSKFYCNILEYFALSREGELNEFISSHFRV